MQDIKTFLAEAARMTEATLEQMVPDAGVEPARLHEAIRWSLFGGGKRMRPSLLIAAGKTFGAAEEDLLTTAAAVEMIHTYSLIHDDLPAMDNDDLRRGRLTCHKKFGEATAILAGDALQAMAFQAIAGDKRLTSEIRIALISDLAQAAGTPSGMVAGQQLDLDAEGADASVERVERIHRAKTGELIRAAAVCGAVIGGAGDEELKAVAGYGSHLGLLFQVTDDLLDATRSTSDLGKTAGKDSAAQKATYPSVHGVEQARELAASIASDALRELEAIDRPTGLLAAFVDIVRDRKS